MLSFTDITTLKGTWQYNGGVSNGKAEGPPTQYTLQRKYTDKTFTAFVLEKGSKPEKYEAGNYTLKGDTCFETCTFNSQTPQAVGKTVTYIYSIDKGIIHLKAVLPGGTVVDDQWKKVR
ncbi:hypothetical protein BEL04_03665 [Mucilaginibacter sp. PPCGB 2223]|nr:hypothetical protein BEL04_03665 [Mucilaginibacter sp. PPCGB 2223]